MIDSIIPKNAGDLWRLAVVNSWLFVIMLVGGYWAGLHTPHPALLIILGCVIGLVVGLVVLVQMPDALDPWKMQRRVMAMSGQELPRAPTVTQTSLLYVALQMEELSEQTTTLHSILRANLDRSQPVHISDLAVEKQRQYEVLLRLSDDSRTLKSRARSMRELLAVLQPGWPDSPLTRKQARDLLDDYSDCAVVVAGGVCASGLPGADAFAEVNRSNISKANPATGQIDKDPSGKWIKGPDYTPPDLGKVLDHYMELIGRPGGWPGEKQS